LLTRWQGEQPGYFGALPQGLAGLGSLRDSVAREAIAHAVLFAHRWVFGVLFWFCLLAPLGLAPAGAVLYHCAEFATRYWRGKPDAEPAASDALRAAVQTAWRVIDWLPVRVTALVFAIVGNFEDAIAAWQQRQADEAQGGAGRDNDAVLLAAAAGALGIRLDADDAAARVPVAEPVKPGVPVQPDRAPAPTDAPAPAYPPDWEPSARADEAALPGRNDMSGSFGAEPDVRHFAQVAGLLWRGVALWLLLLMLLTLAHVLG
jgi:adenosylcobinamide-phosphate synthase